MPERDAEIFEVLIGQMTEDRDIDVVLSKALRVLGHAELFEPLRNLLHCGAPSATVVTASRAKIPERRSDVNCPLTLGARPLARINHLGARRREHCRRLWVGECP